MQCGAILDAFAAIGAGDARDIEDGLALVVRIVECLIGWLKESRRICTRFEKTAINFGGMVRLAFIHRYLRLSAT